MTDEGTHRGSRRTNLHARARGGVQTPGRQDDDHAGRDLDMDHRSGGTLLTVLLSKAPPEERVPAIVDLDFLPDMGRMTARLSSEGPTGCLPDHCVPASAPPLMSLIQSAKLNRHDPYAYLKDVFTDRKSVV